MSSDGSAEQRSPIAQTPLGSFFHGGPVGRADLDEIADKLWFDREGGVDPYVRFGTLLVLSVVIATGGVLGDSTATVIGAMIVAPLMTPIMASALAVVAGDAWHLGRSLAIVAVGVATSIGLAWLRRTARSRGGSARGSATSWWPSRAGPPAASR
jgi:hypothetical protein